MALHGHFSSPSTFDHRPSRTYFPRPCCLRIQHTTTHAMEQNLRRRGPKTARQPQLPVLTSDENSHPLPRRRKGSKKKDSFSDDDHDNSKDPSSSNHSLIDVSPPMLLLATMPFLVISAICWYMGLFSISTSLLTGCLRTLIQLSLLGTILRPIFQFGKIWLVLGYALFMMLLAGYEASSRTKYIFDGQLYCILASLIFNIGWVGYFAFGVLIRPKPVWNPRYLIPIVGMLLGNSINGISLSLDAVTKGMVEQRAEIELYLSFGATKWEAISRLLGEAIRTGATPILNTMRVIGIISIPGMMTGQILGGSPAMTAARYQMLIIFLIGMSTMSVILTNSFLAVEAGFDSHHTLIVDRFQPSDRLRVANMILWILSSAGSVVTSTMGLGTSAPMMPKTATLLGENAPTLTYNSQGNLGVRSLFHSGANSGSDMWKLEISGLSQSFITESQENDVGGATQTRRVLFEDVSLTVGAGDLVLISGPSGVGKSTLLQMISGLTPLESERNHGASLLLGGKSWTTDFGGGSSAAIWRKRVRYVTQSKVMIPGSPMEFLQRITSFASWTSVAGVERIALAGLVHDTTEYLREWSMDESALQKDWAQLSGGEAQRVILAIALASKPNILLFDESTSALDLAVKTAVENSVKTYIRSGNGGACWISHDMQQTERMSEV